MDGKLLVFMTVMVGKSPTLGNLGQGSAQAEASRLSWRAWLVAPDFSSRTGIILAQTSTG
jgi:hypothetical protein